MIDTHVHLNLEKDSFRRKRIIENSHQVGITAFINCATDYPSNFEMLDMLGNDEHVYYSIGIHPKYLPRTLTLTDKEIMESLKNLLTHLRVVAIGEVGLDFSLRPSTEEIRQQKKWFGMFIELALEVRLPLVLHVRDAEEDALEVIGNYTFSPTAGVVHCFGSNLDIAKKFIAKGFYLGIGGRITYEREHALRSSICKIPLNKILLETDAPFLRPAGWKQKRNTSASLPLILEEISVLKGVSKEVVLNETTQNARKLFRI